MKIEKIFRSIPDFNNIELDMVLFESRYPVMFTCKNGEEIYLFICCLMNNVKAEWIGTQTTNENLIELLENKITIRDAFMNITENKIVIEYNGQNVKCKIEKGCNIPEILLPTVGEYMDAEEDEYIEEIAILKKRNLDLEYAISIKPQINLFFAVPYSVRSVWVTDDYFTTDLDTKNVMQNNMIKICSQQVILA